MGSRIERGRFRRLVDLERLSDGVAALALLVDHGPGTFAIGYQQTLLGGVVADAVRLSPDRNARENLPAVRVGYHHDLVSAAAEQQAIGRIEFQGRRSLTAGERNRSDELHRV